MAMNLNNLRDEYISELETELGVTLTSEQVNQITPFFTALARTIINHLTNNMDVSTTVNTPVGFADGALQTTVAIGSPTGPPNVPTSLSGTGTGGVT